MRRGRLLATTIVFAAACAAAGKDSPGDDQPTPDANGTDSSGVGTDDAAVMIDGPPAPVMVTMSQTTGATVGSGSSLACGNTADGTTAENSWYRVFKLADHGIAGPLAVTSVAFGVQQANGLPNVQVKIGTYSGNVTPPPAQLDTALITPITAATFAVPNTVPTATTTVTVPIVATVPANAQMIVEVFSPDQLGTGKFFYLGGNALGESKPSYLRAPACTTPQPKTTAGLGFPMSNLVLTVTGTK